MAAARITVDHVFPLGTYARLMNGSMNAMMDNMVKAAGQIPLSEIAGLAGQPPADLAKLGKTNLNDIMAILDPEHEERTSIMMHSMMSTMMGIMSQLEPSIRDGVAEAYARRFSIGQLADMNRFFDTPSGQAYAANAMTIQADPAVMARMQAIVPVLMQRLPAVMSEAHQATAKLPPPRKFTDLSPADRTRLAALLGVPESQMEANAQVKK